MGDDNDTIKLKQPLSLWEKIKVGVGSFTKSVISYLPRGIIISGLLLGASAVMGNMGGWDIFGTAGLGAGEFIKRMAIGVGIGSVMTGGMGAYQGIKASTEFRNKEVELQERALVRARGHERVREQEQEYTGGYSPQQGLPNLGNESELVRN